MAWTISNAVVYRAKDYTKQWPTHDRESAPEWMSNAKGRRLGNYRWLAPADSSNASALIELYGPKFNGLPGFLIEDENGDGSVDSILISDSAHPHVWNLMIRTAMVYSTPTSTQRDSIRIRSRIAMTTWMDSMISVLALAE